MNFKKCLILLYNRKAKPQIVFFIYGSEEDIIGSIEQMVNILKSKDTFNENELKNYITSAPENILRNGYSDPYYLSYELKQTTLSAGSRFYSQSRGAIGQGAVGFYHFLKNIDTDDLDAISQKLSDITEKYITGSIPTAEYIGNLGYDNFKAKIISLFGGGKKLNDTVFNSGINYNSAAVITKLADSTHFMLAGNFNEAGYKYSGKMDVLARVISSKYLEPVMRGKHGAYGTGMLIDASGVTASAAGLSDIDLAIEIWKGMGDFLRNLDMTQNELNSLIVPTVKQYDEYYNYSENGGVMAITNQTISDIKKIRDEMLDTKVSDLIGYADFIDKIVAQNHIFAVMGINKANNCEFDFEYFANADTLEIIPQLTKNPKQYIFGKKENTFAPDEYITRAEMAEIISRVTVDNQLIPTDNKFCDISDNDWFYNSVNSLASKGIISGYADNRFCPSGLITRAEACAILSKYSFTEESTFENPYSDVSEDDWFFEAVSKMTENGFLTGYEDDTFKPHNHITRAEAVAIINRMLSLEKISNGKMPFDDVDKTHWAYNEIATAATL